ncbi:DNA-directed RNA polymerase subunit RPB2 [uncultured virus]|nr:DNA-directed RNA polymerase subunit RPB2 [uncultured virus]
MAKFLKERLLETADLYSCYVCVACGLFAQRMLRRDNKAYATQNDIHYCPGCKNKTDVAKIKIPYAFKLLVQEMMAMSVVARLKVKEE